MKKRAAPSLHRKEAETKFLTCLASAAVGGTGTLQSVELTACF